MKRSPPTCGIGSPMPLIRSELSRLQEDGFEVDGDLVHLSDEEWELAALLAEE